MIPDHLIDKGVDALINPARTTDTVPDWRLDMYRDTVHRIIEAVAADIWDQGHVCGYSDAQDTARGIRLGAHNPYKRNENA